jgi:pimeloyl-ACP methyl ester carboxylesterase
MKTTNFITLPDGRKLAYAEFGDPGGHPVIYFHGNVSSRLEPLLLGDELISQSGLRLIAPDRPGMGQSDFQPNHGFSDYPKDIVCLADTLGLDKFSIVGISGGGGYVSACAAKIPDRLINAVIISGAWYIMDSLADLPLLNRWIFTLARRFPLLYRGLLKLMLPLYKGDPAKVLATFKQQMSAADYAVLKPSHQIEAYCKSIIEAMHQGTKGTAWDVQLYLRPWDFKIEEIQIPMTFFHGEQDKTIPISLAKRYIDRLPTAKLYSYPDEGHISIVINQFEAIVQALKSDRTGY